MEVPCSAKSCQTGGQTRAGFELQLRGPLQAGLFRDERDSLEDYSTAAGCSKLNRTSRLPDALVVQVHGSETSRVKWLVCEPLQIR